MSMTKVTMKGPSGEAVSRVRVKPAQRDQVRIGTSRVKEERPLLILEDRQMLSRKPFLAHL
jgi:hypothetical protein